MSSFVKIHNIAEAAAWTAGGTDAKPRFEFTVADPDGDPITQVVIRIYDAAVAGNLVQTHTLTGATLAAALANGYYDSSYGMKNKDQANSERWVTYEATAGGVSSGESSRTGFKVCWGQALYEYEVPGGAGSSGWAITNGSPASGTDVALLFRSAASAGGGSGAWASNIGVVTPNNYLVVLVRIYTWTSGTQPGFPDMAFTYDDDTTVPEKWTADPVADWFLDNATYRYGTKAFKFVVDDGNDRTLYPFTVLADGLSENDIAVTPNTDYVYSLHVRTDGALTAGCELRLEIYAGGTMTSPIAVGTVAGVGDDPGKGATTDTSGFADGWQRLHLHFNSGGLSFVRPMVRYDNNGSGSGDAGWVDGAQLEEGIVVSTWHAGQLSAASILDHYGLMLDGMAGAKVFARATTGETANLDDIVLAAVGGGGSGPTSSNLVWFEPGGITDLVTFEV